MCLTTISKNGGSLLIKLFVFLSRNFSGIFPFASREMERCLNFNRMIINI